MEKDIKLSKFFPTIYFPEFMIFFRVPGRPPTLASFRSRFHIPVGQFRYFFKSCDHHVTGQGSIHWIEITEQNEPLPTIRMKLNGINPDEIIVEAKVIDCI